MSQSQRRPRTPPRERFAGNEKQFRLEEEFAGLPEESRGHGGHMQKALYRHGPFTTAIFAFDAGSGLDQHRVEGESFIHVLEGELSVQTSENEYLLRANDVLLLDPGVQHDLRAVKATRMMMTFIMMAER